MSTLTGHVFKKFAESTSVQRLVTTVELGKDLFQQTWPKVGVVVGVHLDGLAIESRKSVIDHDVIPPAILPNSEVKYAYKKCLV